MSCLKSIEVDSAKSSKLNLFTGEDLKASNRKHRSTYMALTCCSLAMGSLPFPHPCLLSKDIPLRCKFLLAFLLAD